MKRRPLVVLDNQGDLIASGNGFTEAFVERVESILRMDDATQAIVATNDDTTIESVMHSVARFQHRTPAWKGGVIADEWQALAEIARRVGNETRHLTRVLLALD